MCAGGYLPWLTVLSRRWLCHERRDTQGTVHPGGMQGRMGMIMAEKNPGRLGAHPGTSIAGVRQSGEGDEHPKTIYVTHQIRSVR
jgi:hypothetical protein